VLVLLVLLLLLLLLLLRHPDEASGINSVYFFSKKFSFEQFQISIVNDR
jgi:hypothetical protein